MRCEGGSKMKVKLNELKQSDDILEIRRVNPVIVSRYRQAVRAGDKFPDIMVQKGTNIIVRGNHRYSAYVEEYGEDHTINVSVKDYKSEAEMIADSVYDNARHGEPLDGIGRRRAIAKLTSLGMDAEKIASLMGVSVKRITELAGFTVLVRGNGYKPVKGGLEHISGQTVSKRQYEEHDNGDRSIPVYAQCEQLIRWIQNGWVDMNDERNTKALERLHNELEKMLEVA